MLDIKPKPAKKRTTQTQGFSLTPAQLKRVKALAKHYDTNMSKVVGALIDDHATALRSK